MKYKIFILLALCIFTAIIRISHTKGRAKVTNEIREPEGDEAKKKEGIKNETAKSLGNNGEIKQKEKNDEEDI